MEGNVVLFWRTVFPARVEMSRIDIDFCKYNQVRLGMFSQVVSIIFVMAKKAHVRC